MPIGEGDTEELRTEQAERAERERARATATDDVTERRGHARRAAKADYLKQKLDERAESEQRVEGEP